MSLVRKKIAPPLVGSDIILVIRPGQNINQVLDCTYDQLVQALRQYFANVDGLVPETRTLTINGVTYDLSQDRSWTVSGGGAVDSVNGQTGVVILALDDLSDVNAPSPSVNQILQWNGTEWVAATIGTAAWGSIATGTGVASQTDLVTYLTSNYVPLSRSITINGVSYDLSVNRTWNVGTVTGVTATAPITSSGGTAPNVSTSMNTNKLIGRGTAGVGVMEEITLGTNLSLTGNTLNATGGGGILHATASGTNTYTASVTPTATSYNDGDAYLIRFTNGNDQSAPTLNIDGLGGKVLYRNNDGELLGGDISDGGEMLCVYNPLLNGGSGAFQCIGISPNSLFAYVTNVDTVAITKGMPVVAWGGTGDRMTVQRAYNTDDAHSAQTVGLVFSNSIGVNQKGFIMIQGLLDGLTILKPPPFDVWVDGDPVFLGSTPGSITKTKPYAPNHLVYLGVVTTTSPGSAGRMYVRVQNGYELDELHNVQAQTPANNDTLYYDIGATPVPQWKTTSVNNLLNTSIKTGSCGVTFDGQGGVISNGRTAYVQVPYNGTLTSWTLVAAQSGSCTITVFKDTYANYPPVTPADNIYSVQPALASAIRNQNLTPTYVGSQATVTAGDWIGFTISGVTTVTWVNLTISITKT